MARDHRQLPFQADRSSIRLADEAFTHERNGWNAGRFGSRTRPQHGGRTTSSASHSGDDSVGSVFFELGRNTRDYLTFFITVGRADNAQRSLVHGLILAL